jgi:hypothetical protein
VSRLDIAKIRRKPQSQTRPSSGNVGYIGAKQTWETAMDDEVAYAGKTSRIGRSFNQSSVTIEVSPISSEKM